MHLLQASNPGTLDIITNAEACSCRSQIFEALDDSRRPYRLAVTSASLAATISAAEAGLGVALVPIVEICPLTMRMVDLSLIVESDPKVTYGVFSKKRTNPTILTALDVIVRSHPGASGRI